MFDICLEPRFVVVVNLDGFRRNTEAFAEGDVITDRLCIYMDIGALKTATK